MTKARFILASLAVALLATRAMAEVPFFSAACPDFDVTSNGKGKVKIDKKKGAVEARGAAAWELRVGTSIVEISQAGGRITVTTKGGKACQVTSGNP